MRSFSWVLISVFLFIIRKTTAQLVQRAGCTSSPPSPINARYTCKQSECMFTCHPNYSFPNGATQVVMVCRNEHWVVKDQNWEGALACHAVCQPPCQHGGICESPNKCRCPTGFSGNHCENAAEGCTGRPNQPLNADNLCSDTKCLINCRIGYRFPDGSQQVMMQCEDGKWVADDSKWDVVPNCEAVCDPPCQNKGTCTAPNHCSCPYKYRGPHCQYSVDNCTLLFNGITECEDKSTEISCKLSCPPEMEFKQSPASVYTCKYSEGVFTPSPIPQCKARKESCHAVGDPHYQTFDGKRYDFMGRCSYYLVKMPMLSIEAENVACRGTTIQEEDVPGLPSCTKTVTVKIAGLIIKLDLDHVVKINGQVTELPYGTENVTVKKVSSTVIQVDLLDYDMQVTWDSATRVYIYAPTTLKDKTAGLCGILNNNQTDDFTTSGGVIEDNVNNFANSWSTEQKCDNVSDVPDPCKESNKPQAEKHCQVIKSGVFKKCHWKVEPESFFNDCVYDMCACQGNYSKCLCPMVAAYADECAHNGIKIDWNEKVKECEEECPPGQEHQVCANLCKTSCADIAAQRKCIRQCVSGCNCPEGEAVDEHGKCVAVEECKCQYEGLPFAPGYEDTRLVDGKLHVCTCTNAQWSCKPTTTPVQCNTKENMEPTDCKAKELITCGEVREEQITCYPGCKCKGGYVLDTSINKCVQPPQCPCYHNGKTYQSNATIVKDCNTCQCQDGSWKCTSRPCFAECSVWGESHYQTFDGQHYDFQGQCVYTLSVAKSENSSFEVTNENMVCSALETTCFKSVTIRLKSGDKEDKITLTKDRPLSSDAKFHHITMRQVGLFIIIEAPHLGVMIRWDQCMRFYINVDSRWKDKVEGLCGNYNNRPDDDFQTPSKETVTSATAFGNSWKLNNSCPDAVEIKNPCKQRPNRHRWAFSQCGVLKSSTFAPCHGAVPVDMYLEKCLFDACACDKGGDCQCLCTAIAAYVQECSNKGIFIKWRSQNLCPIQCDQLQEYTPCISTCPIETCSNLLYLAKNKCQNKICVEGCAPKTCPEGQVYVNSSFTECVPKDQCSTYYKCDPDNPYKEHPTNCYKYYKCECTMDGPRYIEKTCVPEFYNPKTKKCDDRSVVKEIKPECKEHTCGPLQPVTCSFGEVKTMKKDEYGCDLIVCQCKPPEQCEPAEPLDISLDDGFVQILNTSGCCPRYVIVCKPEKCPQPKPCPQYYVQKSEKHKGKCCPLYTCHKPQDKCIYENKYTAAREGGERPRTEEEKETVLKNPEDSWEDGPCRQCTCSPSSTGDYEATCTKNTCSSTDLDADDYILKEVPVFNKCCPDIKRVACKHADQVYQTGESWINKDDPCTKYRCTERAGNALKETQVISCDKCHAGFEYTPPTKESGQCCGSCKPTACMVDGQTHPLGQKWQSDDHCTIFWCLADNGTIQLRAERVSCPQPSQDYVDNYFYETITIPGQCCKKYKTTACKVDGKEHQVGTTWPSPDGNKCKKITCVKNEKGEIVKQESFEICRTNCPKGWEYHKSDNNCCGECVQVACLFNGQLKQLGEEWTSKDHCKKYLCAKIDGQLMIVSSEEACPSIEECPEENIYTKGCCKHCKDSGGDYTLCKVQKVPSDSTVGIVQALRQGHGQCVNKEPIDSFTKCKGSCLSSSIYSTVHGRYKNDCSCCQILDYTVLKVNLECDDGHQIVMEVSVPLKCGCEDGCSDIKNFKQE